MYNFEDIRVVHLEITSKCNASCPLCPRTVSGGPMNPHLPLQELTLEDVQSAFSEDFVKQLKKLYMCGNYGDPAAAQDSLEVFRWLRQVNPSLSLEIYSNGGVRNQDYWRQMAQVVTRGRFAIDGLQDTNHLYRKGVVWEKVEQNLRAFTEAGGLAQWDFIVFRHNEHQVEEARALAKKWGVRDFRVKKTGRFFSSEKSQRKDEQRVLKKNGELDYTIQLPKNPKYVNPALLSDLAVQSMKKDKPSPEGANKKSNGESGQTQLHTYLEQSSIDCKAIKEQSIFLSADGYVFPCCWIGLETYLWYQKPKSSELWKMLETVPGGVESLRATKIGLRKALKSEFFKKTLMESWEKESFADGKSKRCAKTCGRKEFDLIKSQTESVKSAPQLVDSTPTPIEASGLVGKLYGLLKKRKRQPVVLPRKTLHLEISTKCTLKCLACPRTNFPGQFPVLDMGLDVVKQIVSDPGFEVKRILLCGDHGDPIYHKNFHEVIAILQKVEGRPPIKIATNGSHRDQAWWRKTAELLGPDDMVVFGVDGLESTNPIHRVNSDWQSIMTAIKTLKTYGECSVVWQWLLFNFNEGQLQQAREIFDDMNIDCFIVAKSSRGACVDRYDPSISLEEAYDIFTKKNTPALQSRP